MKKKLNIINIFFLTGVALIMLSPSINGYFHLIPEVQGNENRKKTEMPVFDMNSLDGYVISLNQFYSDNFSLRDNFIKMNHLMEHHLFNVSPTPDNVVIGKQGWFYDKNNQSDFKGKNKFTNEELSKLKHVLKTRIKYAREQGAQYYTVIIPNKMRVYPEYLPGKIIETKDSTRYGQLVSLGMDTTLHVIDVLGEIVKHKNQTTPLYQKTDGHWNALGAYYGYSAIMNYLSKSFPGMNEIPLDSFNIETEKRVGGALVKMADLGDEYPEFFVNLKTKFKSFTRDGIKRDYHCPSTIDASEYQIIKVNEKAKGPKCLIIRDSFTLLMIPFLQEQFKESVFIHDEWKYRLREDLISQEKPTIILNIVFEGGLGELLK